MMPTLQAAFYLEYVSGRNYATILLIKFMLHLQYNKDTGNHTYVKVI